MFKVKSNNIGFVGKFRELVSGLKAIEEILGGAATMWKAAQCLKRIGENLKL